MEFHKSARPNFLNGAGPEMATFARASSSFGKLRHLGFRMVDLPVDSEIISDGPSVFNELGYCKAGEVLLVVWHGFQIVETFVAKAGDFFFVPAGVSYNIYNTHNDASRMVVATARDGMDVLSLPLGEGGRVLVEDATAIAIKTNGAHAGCRTDTNESEPSFSDRDGRVVLFVDHRRADLRREKTIESIFDKEVVAREFEIKVSDLPDFSFACSDPVVMRPMTGTNQIEADGCEWEV